MLLEIAFALCVINVAVGQEAPENSCALIPAMENLNASAYSGSWSVIKQSDTTTNKCVTVNITRNDVNTTVVYQYNITSKETFVNTTNKFVVLGTNYTSYAVILKCDVHNNTLHPNLWILSRNKSMSEIDTNYINELLKQKQLENITLTTINNKDADCTMPSSSNILTSSFTAIILALISIY